MAPSRKMNVRLDPTTAAQLEQLVAHYNGPGPGRTTESDVVRFAISALHKQAGLPCTQCHDDPTVSRCGLCGRGEEPRA